MSKILEFFKNVFTSIYNYFVHQAKGELLVSLLAMLIIAIIAIVLGASIKKADPKKATKGLAFAAEYIVTFADDKVCSILGNVYLPFAPYFLFLVLYIPVTFFMSLFGFASPFTYYTIPLTLALVTWIGIQVSAIKYQKLEYLKSFASPLPAWMPILAPINLLSKLSPLLSLSIRLFGNALAGYILMWLVYWGTGMLSNLLIPIEGLNAFGMVIAPILHAYFDAFGAYIQMTIFTTLTLLLIAAEIPAPVNVDLNKIKKEKEEKKARKKNLAIR